MKSSHEIDLLRAEKEKELDIAEDNLDTVELEIISIRRNNDENDIKIKDLQGALIKAKSIVRKLKTEKTQLDRDFWSAKSSGI
jgi:hypothetical protein